MTRLMPATALTLGLSLLSLCGGCNIHINMTKQALDGVTVTLNAPTGSQPKQLTLGWAVSGTNASSVTTYKFYVRPSSTEDYQAVTGTLNTASTSATVSLTSLHTLNWTQAQVKVQACDSTGSCVDSTEQALVNALPSMVTYFKALNSAAGFQFGTTLALSKDGNTLVVGAPYESGSATAINGTPDTNAPSAGAAYVYVRANGGWSQQAYVKASNAAGGDLFGSAVTLSSDGNTLVVGAPGEASASVSVPGDNSLPGAGAAYVFTRSSSTWTQAAYLKASNPGAKDAFGGSVSLSADGTTLAVGATGESSGATGINGAQNDNSVYHAGAVYVFTSTQWAQQAYVKVDTHHALSGLYGEYFGQSLALSSDGNWLAVGAAGEPNASGQPVGPGYVYVFQRNSSVWSQTWSQAGASAASGFGTRVALSADGSVLAVGAPNLLNSTGAVYTFLQSSGAWTAQSTLQASNAVAGYAFGSSVAFAPDGSILAVGATGESSGATGVGGSQSDNSASGAGAVYTFVPASNAWSQKSYVKAPNLSAAGAAFGRSLALSGEGSLAVGASGEASPAQGIGGSQIGTSAANAGAAFIY